MTVFRPALELRVSPCPAPDKLDLVLERRPDPPDGISVVYVADVDAVVSTVKRLVAADWPARGLFPDQGIQNRRVLAWAETADCAPLVVPVTLPAGTRRAWRGVWMLSWPSALADFPARWIPAGTDELEAFVDILPSREDVAVHERRIDADPPAGRLHRIRFLRDPALFAQTFDAARTLFLHQLFERLPAEAASGAEAIDAPYRLFDVDAAQYRTEAARDRILRALDYLQRQGWLDYGQASPGTMDWKAARRRELAETVAWMESGDCRWNGLLAALGEPPRRPCGICDRCRGKPATWLR